MRLRGGSDAALLRLPHPLLFICLVFVSRCKAPEPSFNKYWACSQDWLSAFRCAGSHPEAARVKKGITQPRGAPARLRRRVWGVHALASALQDTKGQYFRVTDELEREASGWFFCFGPGN